MRITTTTTTLAEAENGDYDLLIVQITRASIEARYFAGITEQLHQLSDSPGLTRRYQGRLEFVVSGYDDDPRYLFEIPAVRAYFKELIAQWPYWLHFLACGSNDAAQLFILALDYNEVIRDDANARVELDRAEYLALLDRLMSSALALHQRHGLSKDESAKILAPWIDNGKPLSHRIH